MRTCSAQARDLLAVGTIGDLREIEVIDHFDFPPLMPYSWLYSLADGGGMLFNVYPHVLAQVQFVSDGRAVWATGVTERVLDRVPVGSPVHDFRTWAPMTEAEAADVGMAAERRRSRGDGDHRDRVARRPAGARPFPRLRFRHRSPSGLSRAVRYRRNPAPAGSALVQKPCSSNGSPTIDGRTFPSPQSRIASSRDGIGWWLTSSPMWLE